MKPAHFCFRDLCDWLGPDFRQDVILPEPPILDNSTLLVPGDAILIDVLQGISDATVIVADITARNELDGRPIRNANVMCEIPLG